MTVSLGVSPPPPLTSTQKRTESTMPAEPHEPAPGDGADDLTGHDLRLTRRSPQISSTVLVEVKISCARGDWQDGFHPQFISPH